MLAAILYERGFFADQAEELAYNKEFIDPLTAAGFDYVIGYTYGKSEEEIIDMLKDADLILSAGATPLTANIINSLPNLKVIQKTGIGVDTIDAKAATARGIPVMNCRGYCVEELAVHACAMLLGLHRDVPMYDDDVRGGGWMKGMGGAPLRVSNLTVGICGLGGSGRISARIWHEGFGCKVIAYDPYVSQETASDYGVTMVDFDTLCSRSDFLTIHAPLSEETYHMFDEHAFSLMKPNCIIVSTARGKIIKQEALVDALKTKKIAAAGLDVFECEPLEEGNPLVGMKNVTLMTPHVAFKGIEAGHISKQLAATLPCIALKDNVIHTFYVTNEDVIPQLEGKYQLNAEKII